MTQNTALPPLTKDLADAFIASATLWLARLLGLLFHPRAATRKRLFLRLVQFGERWTEYVLFVAAAQRVFAHRAQMNGLASKGQWKQDLEKKAA